MILYGDTTIIITNAAKTQDILGQNSHFTRFFSFPNHRMHFSKHLYMICTPITATTAATFSLSYKQIFRLIMPKLAALPDMA